MAQESVSVPTGPTGAEGPAGPAHRSGWCVPNPTVGYSLRDGGVIGTIRAAKSRRVSVCGRCSRFSLCLRNLSRAGTATAKAVISSYSGANQGGTARRGNVAVVCLPHDAGRWSGGELSGMRVLLNATAKEPCAGLERELIENRELRPDRRTVPAAGWLDPRGRRGCFARCSSAAGTGAALAVHSRSWRSWNGPPS